VPPPIKNVIQMMVPKVDADGNELGGVPTVLRDAPLGTYLGWNITSGPGDPGFNNVSPQPFHAGRRYASRDPGNRRNRIHGASRLADQDPERSHRAAEDRFAERGFRQRAVLPSSRCLGATRRQERRCPRP